jgi:chemotaxis signal transduction protein
MTKGTRVNPAEEEGTAGGGGQRTLIFRVGSDYYGIPLDVVMEVLEPPESPVAIPGAPAWVGGLLNHHGQVVPVIRMDAFLGAKARSACTQVVIVDLRNVLFGLAVEQIESLEEVGAEGPSLHGRKRSWYHGSLLEHLEPGGLAEEIRARLKQQEGGG